jgi:membrane-associated phospholipid phosphatase
MSESVKRPLAACLGCLVGLATLASVAYGGGSFGRLDARVLNRLSGYEETSAGSAAELFMYLGDPLPQLALLAVACLIALRRGLPRRAIAAAVLVGGANLTTQVLKALLSHPRYQPLLGWRQVGPTAFPSGHSTAALSMALAYLLVVPRAWRPATAAIGGCLVLAVSCSMVVLHHHYPSDVLGGWLVAAGWFFAVLAVLRALRREPSTAGALKVGVSGRR